jgi:hypothetical protein
MGVEFGPPFQKLDLPEKHSATLEVQTTEKRKPGVCIVQVN